MYRLTERDKRAGITQVMIDEAYERVKASHYVGTDLEPYIAYLPQYRREGGRYVIDGVVPYMTVDGRVREMTVANKDRPYSLMTFINPAEGETMPVDVNLPDGRIQRLYCPPQACLAVYIDPEGGLHVGTAKLGGDRGAAASNPYEDAETSAVGRALAMAGYGLLPGSGIASAEEIARAREEEGKSQQPESQQPKAGQARPRPKAGSTNGKAAKVKTAAWPQAVQKIIEHTGDYYLGPDGKPNFYHLVGAAAKCGYPEITDDNIRDVVGALIDHALAGAQAAREGNDDLPF